MSDRREELDDPEEAFRLSFEGKQAGMWTALPGIIESFDPDAMTCTVQPTIQGVRTLPDRTKAPVTMPLLLDCPVVFQGGGGATLTFPLAQGDECLVVFASRCIDGWWQSGGVQPQAEVRMHDLSDGFVLPGVRSQPRKFTVAGKPRLTNDEGDTYVELDPAGQVSLVADGASVVVGGGAVAITGALTINGQPYATHKHLGVTPGGGQSGIVAP